MGFDEDNARCYRVFDPTSGTVRKSVHVTFDEELLPGRQRAVTDEEDYDLGRFTRQEQQAPGVPHEKQQAPGAPLGQQALGAPLQTPGASLEQQALGAPQTQQHGMQLPHVGAQGAQVGAQGAQPGQVGAQGAQWDPGGRPRREIRSRMCLDPSCIEQGPHLAHLCVTRSEHALVAVAEVEVLGDPVTYAEAMRSPEAQRWDEAMLKEMGSLMGAGTWTLCTLPPGAKVIGVRWVNKTKRDEMGTSRASKARLVAQGYRQVPGVDCGETFAPVARLSSLRLVLALAAKTDWDVDQMDVETAFLNAPVQGEVYVKQPPGHEVAGA